MNKIFSFLQIIIYAIIFKIKQNNNIESKTNKILLIMDQYGIGDAVCALDAFYNLSKYAENGFVLYIASTSSVIHFLEQTKSTFNAHFITLDLDRQDKLKLQTFRDNLIKLNIHYWREIVCLNRFGLYLGFLFFLCSTDKIICQEYYEQKIGILEKYIKKQFLDIYTIYIHDTEFIMNTYEKIIKYVFYSLFNSRQDFQYEFYKIPKLQDNNINITENYCIVSPNIAVQMNHAYYSRRWPLDRFVEIIDFIIDHSNMMVYLCGVKNDDTAHQYILNHSKHKTRIINFAGKTTFQEWIELVRNSRFVFGNDSGYIHLASYLGVPSFVLAGYWNFGRFFPYKGNIPNGRIKPVDIRIPEVPCFDCIRRNSNSVEKNECNLFVKKYRTYKCIYDISVEQVKKTILQSGILNKK